MKPIAHPCFDSDRSQMNHLIRSYEKCADDKERLASILKYIRGGILAASYFADHRALNQSILATIDDLAGDIIQSKTTV